MEYSKSVPFAGQGARALDVARSTFVGQGFQIAASSDYELRVVGPGMNSTREDPLKGVSEASLVIRASTIEIKAALGGAQKMKTFLRLFPLGMGLLFLIAFGTLAAFLPNFRHWWVFLIPVLALSPWLFLAPMIARSIENKTKQAV
ncbi:MAG TPA: hypothetical protein VM095_01120, partial [Pyrinomonadaceae bacterium]|nr:hypothetical protein [Pyrinomonadaceae bacterium]